MAGFALIGNAAFSAPGQLRVTYNPTFDVTTISGNTDADADAEFQIALAGNQVALNASTSSCSDGRGSGC